MIDIRLLRSDPDAVKAAIARRGEETAGLDRAVELDAGQRALAEERDRLRNEVNTISQEVGGLHRDGRADEAANLQARSRELGEQEEALAAEANELADEIREILLRVPNIPDDDCPNGAGEADNVVVRYEHWDEDAYGDHQRVPHWEVGEELGILDVERGTKLSGSMFVMYTGQGATLCRALIQYGLDRNADAYREMRPPSLVKTETMVSTGHLPKFVDDAYHLERDDLWAIPTAEVPLTSFCRDEVLNEADLPVRVFAFTPCFRSEAGSWGRDVRGIKRLHQFDKIEMNSVCTAGQSAQLYEEFGQINEWLLQALELPYRVVEKCGGDAGYLASHRQRDLDVWLPGTGAYMEVMTDTNTTDYQARRMNIRFRGKGSLKFCHTVNDTGCAMGRMLISIVENYQQEGGSVKVPVALRQVVGKELIEPTQ